jgi:hypothetical protein
MITIGFSSHHAEALPYARHHMEQHEVIVLEEAPVPEFVDMLENRLPVDEYVMGLDSGFPEFQRRMCQILRDMHRQGRKILQVEPYLATLLQIHERLAEGATPEDVIQDSSLSMVYQAEKRATGALLDYYKRSLKAPFTDVVEAVNAFAQADADRLLLRERLRAGAIKSMAFDGADTYVEAGYIHYPLYRYLKRAVGHLDRIRVVFLLAPVVRRLRGRRRNMGPGDILTLYYALHGKVPDQRAGLLAARSLIYIKLLQKDELVPGLSSAPHSEDQARVNDLVDCLSLDDCQALFDQIRLAKRERALKVAEAFMGEKAARQK